LSHAKWIIFEGVKNATGIPLITAIPGVHDTYYIGDEWTLSVEILFYFIVALFIFAFGELTRSKLGVQASFCVLGLEFFGNYIREGYSFYFLLGILLFCIRSRKDFLIMSIPMAVCIFHVYVHVLTKIQNQIESVDPTLPKLIASFFTFLLVLTIFYRDKFSCKSVRRANLIEVLSQMTFPIYLLHETFGTSLAKILFNNGFPPAIAYSLTFGVVLLISLFSVRKFEPALRAYYRQLANRDF
jgi:peptidoglycan/LPS O-acetylase OafA/YrhL